MVLTPIDSLLLRMWVIQPGVYTVLQLFPQASAPLRDFFDRMIKGLLMIVMAARESISNLDWTQKRPVQDRHGPGCTANQVFQII